MPTMFIPLHGRALALGHTRELLSNGLNVTMPAVDATITVGAEVSNARAITIQLKDSTGKAITYVETVELVLFANAAKTAFASTGGSTGIAVTADGDILPIVAKKYWIGTTEANGAMSLSWTDTGTEAAFLGVRLPNGNIVMSTALTNA